MDACVLVRLRFKLSSNQLPDAFRFCVLRLQEARFAEFRLCVLLLRRFLLLLSEDTLCGVRQACFLGLQCAGCIGACMYALSVSARTARDVGTHMIAKAPSQCNNNHKRT